MVEKDWAFKILHFENPICQAQKVSSLEMIYECQLLICI